MPFGCHLHVALMDRLRKSACQWPAHARQPPPRGAEEALDPEGPWGERACGVEVRPCHGPNADRGLGAFATRQLAKGSVVGVYWGEHLRAAAVDRRAAEGDGCDYVLTLIHDDSEDLVEAYEAMCPGRGCYIDAQDPSKSTWTRFINHESEWAVDSVEVDGVEVVLEEPCPACNVCLRTNVLAGLAWFEAKRDIHVGEELCFDYGPQYAKKILTARSPWSLSSGHRDEDTRFRLPVTAAA